MIDMKVDDLIAMLEPYRGKYVYIKCAYHNLDIKEVKVERYSHAGDFTHKVYERVQIVPDSGDMFDIFDEMLDRPITDYPLSVRVLCCLKSADINTLRELVRFTEMDLLKFRNFGKRSISELSDFIKDHDLTWGMNV